MEGGLEHRRGGGRRGEIRVKRGYRRKLKVKLRFGYDEMR